jgi:hypothetical protein
MSTSKTIDFKLSDSDRNAVADSRREQVKLSAKDLSEARASSFIPWNCRFTECGTPASQTKKAR